MPNRARCVVFVSGNQHTRCKTIHGLQVGIVNVDEYPLRRWYYASPQWYYHHLSAPQFLEPRRFPYTLVDPALKTLCQLAHRFGIGTTPSCQGHFYEPHHFQKVWQELKRQAMSIRGTGLLVRDSETGTSYCFEMPDYILPWSTCAAFVDTASVYQTHGYIGLIIPPDRGEIADQLARDRFRTETARIELDRRFGWLCPQQLFSVHVEPRTPAQRDTAWEEVTTYLHRLLKSKSLINNYGEFTKK